MPDSFLPQICQKIKLIYTTFLKSQGTNGFNERQLDVPGSQSEPCEKQGQRDLLEDKHSMGMGPGLDTTGKQTAHFATEFCPIFKNVILYGGLFFFLKLAFLEIKLSKSHYCKGFRPLIHLMFC